MVHTKGNVWRLFFILKQILPPQKFHKYILLNSGLWSNLLRKTAVTTTNYFAAEEKCACIRKNRLSVNSTGHDLDASFL